MTPTPELIQELRELLDEVIPQGGTESDTRFSNEQLERLIYRANNIYAAAAEGWTRKAAMLQRELGQIESYSVGQERYDMRKLQDALNYALKMAEVYSNMSKSSMGSIVLRIQPPEVL
ncbi:conserved hypothetical protein [Caldicellulosiruptor hydrothermalis 108]|uniref:Uncharacterized protein n=1 Tax=Caldicellulosiruptor hydrothermalis (strain DSM 18901 / VKM B-2411 / 108) TaxID=632292 RepID=E4QE10_CALH1|nr:hypothetical protein [Caldicellulosiruptor hydrothermalis]ADQ06504.1 conserved hypothetical protein [Caldicellulosiruptor hydrothermalis 108]